MKRLRGLDGLRGIAVILVVFFHYTSGYAHVMHPHTPGLLGTLFSGSYGVELFFIISGYVILMTVERSPAPLLFHRWPVQPPLPAFRVCGAVHRIGNPLYRLSGRRRATLRRAEQLRDGYVSIRHQACGHGLLDA